MLLGRTANGLYWMSRYIERAENMARLLDAGLRMALTRTASSSEEWNSVVVSAGCEFSFRNRHPEISAEAVSDFLLRAVSTEASTLDELVRSRSRKSETASAEISG